MLVALAYREGLRLPRVFALALIPVGFVAIAATMNFEAAPRCLYWGLPATCIVAGCVFAGDPKPSIGWKAAAFVGDCSYALYLVHPVALSFPRQIGINFAHSHPFAYCLFIVAVAIACGIAVHLFFERPVTIFLRHSKVSFSSPSPAA
jgi:peptidoglycan/LPS O-acetylase OafA/YrhL